MTKSNTSNKDKQASKIVPSGASCMNCQHSRLLQYGENPLIAECCAKPQPGNTLFPYERMVASMPACPQWERYAYKDRIKYICVMRAI